MLFGDPTEEQREAAIIEKRRRMEKERRERILDPKKRQTGRDSETLLAQIEEKKERERLEKQMEKEYAEYCGQVEERILEAERATVERQRAMRADLNEFRKQHQTFEMRREYDINHPRFQAMQQPIRTGDEDERLGVSSGQVMAGEDLQMAERVKMQKAQLHGWLEEQKAEKERLALKAKEEERQADEAVMAGLAKIEAMQRRADEQRAGMRRETLEMNRAIREETEAARRARLEEERAQEAAHVTKEAGSAFLNEARATTVSAVDPNRYVPYNYKGLTREAVDAIHTEVEGQVVEKQARAAREAQEEEEAARYEQSVSRAIMLEERRVARLQREQRQRLAEELAAQKEEQARAARAREEELANKATDDFFGKFGQSSR